MDKPSGRWSLRKPLVLALVLAASGLLLYFGRDSLALSTLAEREQSLLAFTRERPVLVCAVAFLLYVVATGLSLPFGGVLTVAMGWFLSHAMGPWTGVAVAIVLVNFAATTGSTLAFLLSRYLFRDWVRARFGGRLEHFNRQLEREGAWYLFTLRLVPVVPFWVVNLVMGLTPMRTRTFWWVSQLGMLAGTCVFVWAGSAFPSLAEAEGKGLLDLVDWRILAALILLGMLPLALRTFIGWWRT